MAKTPRFVIYYDSGIEYVIHMWQPRFVAKVTGKDSVEIIEEWEVADSSLIESIKKKMESWMYFGRNDRK